MIMAILDEIRESIIGMKRDLARELTQQALDEGLEAEKILHESLIPAMDTVGQEYEQGIKFIPEILIASKAMLGALDLLKPILASSGAKSEGKVVLGTVEGDVHDIGINLVGMMMEGAGFEVMQLGADTSTEEFIQAVKNTSPDILGMSALLTTTMMSMKDVIAALKEHDLRDKVKVMVGGATLSQRFADECGADGYAPDAAQATVLAKKLLKSV
jgi:5-methyltetrahydrofolate--homocysteine methyltransferase